jgi:UDP-N-acetylglucosamine--N-acetylmuramyl-(pentapeptide) pyrophosphoryl-undecaprenol N-acetylglucosamine transferase
MNPLHVPPSRSALTPPTHYALIAAAGTGGHIMPGLAIASQLQARHWAVQWLGTAHGMENKLVPAAGVVLNQLHFAGLRGKGALGTVKGAWQLLGAFFDSLKVLRRVKPSVLVGMGGYVCVPAAWAARVLGVPVVLVNADADLLLSNRNVAGFAKTVCCGFAGTAAQLRNALVTGNPIRAAVANIAPPEQRYAARSGALNVLVVGGSLGAQVLNGAVPAALALLKAQGQHGVNVLHQTGEKQVSAVQNAYQRSGISATVVPFIDDMAKAYAQADVVICRAGAVTVSELCAAGVPAILVPLLATTTTHQSGNAQLMAAAGAGIHLPQAQLSPELLAQQLALLNRAALLRMAIAARQLGKPQAAQTVADAIEAATKPQPRTPNKQPASTPSTPLTPPTRPMPALALPPHAAPASPRQAAPQAPPQTHTPAAPRAMQQTQTQTQAQAQVKPEAEAQGQMQQQLPQQVPQQVSLFSQPNTYRIKVDHA